MFPVLERRAPTLCMEGKEPMSLPSSGSGNLMGFGPGTYAHVQQRNSEIFPLPTSSMMHNPAPVLSEPHNSAPVRVEAQKLSPVQPEPHNSVPIWPDHTRSPISVPSTTGIVAASVPSSMSPNLSSPPVWSEASSAIVPHFGGTNASGSFTCFGSMKKKRGRPRKYAPDGSIALAVTPLLSMPSTTPASQKQACRRPRGSGKKQQLAALGSGGVGFTPHAITVAAGEDVAAKIMSFSQQGPRGVCILSANGAVSNVTLRQPAISGGTVTYEGRFEILYLSGSFLPTEAGGTRSRTGGLSISLAGPDGRVLGGGVAGMLIAATPIQVVVGSFITVSKKAPKPVLKVENACVTDTPNIGNAADRVTDTKPVVTESPPRNQSVATSCSDSESSRPQMIQPQQFGWSGSHLSQGNRPSTDIDMSLPGS